MKSDLSLGDLKWEKMKKSFIKKSSQIEFDFFFEIEPPCETRTSRF